MRGKLIKARFLMFVILAVIVALYFSNASIFARTSGTRMGNAGSGNRVSSSRFVSHAYGARGYSGYTHYYRGNAWHSRGWFGFDRVVAFPPIGAVVPFLPFGCTTLYIGGFPYYYYDDIFFSPCPVGYIVVPAPDTDDVAVPATSESSSESADVNTITVNIPKSKGGYKAITLTKKDGGYVGPQGEFYPGHPSVAQLKALYGE